MRHIVCIVLGAATAYWLAPDLHTLPPRNRYIAMAAIFAVFFVLDLVAGRVKPAKKPGKSTGTPYAAPAKRR